MLTGLRSFAFMAFLVMITLVLAVFSIPLLVFWRGAARRIAKLWTRTILSGLKLITGISHRIEGADQIPQGGALVVANHQSMWETVALYAILPRPVVILRKELARIPIYGWWAKPSGNIVVDRKGGATALRAMRAAAREKIAAGEQVIVFPEGTRVAPGTTAKFHPGVAGIYGAVDAPCTPVAHNSGQFWRFPGMMKVPGEITVRFLPPIEPGLDRRAFLNTVKTRIEQARPDLQENLHERPENADD